MRTRRPTSPRDGESAGQGQGRDGVLAHEGGEAPCKGTAVWREKAFPAHPPGPGGRAHPGAWGLTEVRFLIRPFEMHPFGGGLDEEVADQVTAVLAWTKTEEGSVGVGKRSGARSGSVQRSTCASSSGLWGCRWESHL